MSNNDEDEIFEVEEIKKSSYAKVEKEDLKGVQKYKMKVEEFLQDRHIIVILCLVAIIVVEFLLINNKSRLLRMIFLNKDNEFQWLAGTAIAAMLTFLFTSINTVKKNKADLVANARIEWIQEIKGIMATYLTDINYCLFLFQNLHIMSKDANNPEYEKKFREVKELANKIIGNRNLLHLHLSDNEDNKQLNKCIDDCSEWIVDIFEKVLEKKGNDASVDKMEYKKTPINNLLLVSRDYIKREWDQAKNGK